MDAQRQSRFERGDDVVVMKFGGTSVEDSAAIRRLIGIVESRLDAQPVVVVSALAKVTDQLLEAGNAAAKGHLGFALATVRNIYVRHEQLADSMVGNSAYGSLDRELRCEFQALESLLHDVDVSRELDLKAQDRLLGFGECFSSKLVSEALCEAGLKAGHVDARSCIVTDARHGQASPVWDVTSQRLLDVIDPLLQAGAVPVLGGFIASTSDGVPTTLGRGGSDFSATIIGAALGASRVEIWTDVDGVMTTDPKFCPDARVIRKMSFDEAAELAHYGAKVLHPATLAPAMRENIPVFVLNSRQPEGPGTEITARVSSANGVSAITAKRNVAAVDLQSGQGLDSALLNTVFTAFDDHSCAVDVVGTSLGRISLLVGSTAALPEIAARLQSVVEVQWENHKALVCLVGENIRRQPDVASRVFAAVSDMDVRVLCQGASDRTISFLVDEAKVEESVQRLHRMFFSKVEPVRDWGGISSAFCQAG
ncbi:MAG TPA: aspartate kinase [Candidatus Dormibacteraeota bacterium]|nr:aspartate kinase [Candidatus Dormibacteraeota bacterium]